MIVQKITIAHYHSLAAAGLACLCLLGALSAQGQNQAQLTGSVALQDMPAMDCVVTPHKMVDLSAPVRGVVSAVHVRRSEFVRRGEIVAELASAVERASVKLAQARADIDSEREIGLINLEFDKRRKQRVDALFGQKVVSEQNRDDADRELVLSERQLKQANELKQIRTLELDRARELLNEKIVRSTIDGFVVDEFKAEGEYVEDQPILRIAQLDPLNVEAIVPMALYGEIQLGMMAQVVPESVAQAAYQAQVTMIDRIGDAGSGTFGVRLEMPNGDYQLPAGVKCELKFTGEIRALAQRDERPAPVSTLGSRRAQEAAVTTGELVTASKVETIVKTTVKTTAETNETPLLAATTETSESRESNSGSKATPEESVAGPESHAESASSHTEVIGYITLGRKHPLYAGARKDMAKYSALGITDMMVMPRGEFEKRVSFGVYLYRSAAQRRCDDLLDLGIPCEVAERTRAKASNQRVARQ